MLLGKTSDTQPNVRCNSCWALGRYAAFRVQDAAEEGDSAAGAEVEHIIRALLERAQVGPPSYSVGAMRGTMFLSEGTRGVLEFLR